MESAPPKKLGSPPDKPQWLNQCHSRPERRTIPARRCSAWVHLILAIGISWILAAPFVKADDGPLARPNALAIANACSGCHGFSGRGNQSIPPISGKSEAEFVRIMQEFRSGQRASTVMGRIARGYRDEDFAAVAQLLERR